MVHHLAEANNNYMGERYDSSKPSIYITYIEENNLYGWAMSQPLPTGRFKWIKEVNSFTPKKISNLVAYSKKGHLFEVNVEYPHHLHNQHNDLPSRLCQSLW